MKYILFIIITSTALLSDFNRSSSGIVYDSQTKLFWQDEYPYGTSLSYTWYEALSYCENLTLGGYDDWRLPNFNELYSIKTTKDNGGYKNGATVNPVFESVWYGEYWSSTTLKDVDDDNNAWYINFQFSWDGFAPKDNEDSTVDSVICVRN